MPYEPPPALAALSLAEIAAMVEARQLPPLTQWSPASIGDSEMRIGNDGRWYHRDSAITRPAMVRAFSTLLMRDEVGQHWLLTPQQKLLIVVEDAAFIAVDVAVQDAALVFRLSTDEFVIAGPDHRLHAEGDLDTPALYLDVRNGCRARLNRSTYEQLAHLALDQPNVVVTSQGETFSLLPR